MLATDNIKALAKRNNVSVAFVRETATETAGLQAGYSSSRKTWFIDADATTVRVFNAQLAQLIEDERADGELLPVYTSRKN